MSEANAADAALAVASASTATAETPLAIPSTLPPTAAPVAQNAHAQRLVERLKPMSAAQLVQVVLTLAARTTEAELAEAVAAAALVAPEEEQVICHVFFVSFCHIRFHVTIAIGCG